MTVKDIIINPVATEPWTVTGQWQWSNLTNQPSGSKQVRTDTGNWAAATVVAISTTDNAGVDRSADLAMVKDGDYINLAGGDSNIRFIVSGNAPQAGYYTYAVSLASQSGSAPASGTMLDVSLQIAVTGYASKITVELLPGTVNPITPEIGEDLVNLIATALQTVSHLVATANFNIHMQSGPIIPYTFTIAPPIAGKEFPPSG